MTTNKPTTYWASCAAFERLESRHNNAPYILTVYPADLNDLALVRLSDYEALQAELKKAVAALTDGRFTRCDGPAGWRPPLGNPAGTLIDRIDSLEDECEKLREHLQNLIDQTTPLEPVPGNPMWSRRIQLDEVIAERDSLRVEREKLRKDAKRYVPLHEAVQRAAAELPEGWEIQLCVARDSGGVELIGPDGTEDFHTDNERLDYTVIDALEFSIDAAKQEGN